MDSGIVRAGDRDRATAGARRADVPSRDAVDAWLQIVVDIDGAAEPRTFRDRARRLTAAQPLHLDGERRAVRQQSLGAGRDADAAPIAAEHHGVNRHRVERLDHDANSVADPRSITHDRHRVPTAPDSVTDACPHSAVEQHLMRLKINPDDLPHPGIGVASCELADIRSDDVCKKKNCTTTDEEHSSPSPDVAPLRRACACRALHCCASPAAPPGSGWRR